MRTTAWAGGLVLGVGLMLTCQRADAVITRLTPLKGVLAESQFIFTAKVDALDPDKPSVVLTVDEDLKGKAPFRRLPINLTGDSEAQKEKDTPQLLKRLAPQLPLVVFVHQRGKKFVVLAFTNGTWFQITGEQGDEADKVRWGFAHCERYLRRTFKGTTEELKQTAADALADKKQPPEPDTKEPPGLGPEVKTEEKPREEGQARRGGGPLFAVIPTLGIGGPLALLALLFPSVFGGMTGQLKRWMALLSVLSLNSTLLVVQDWFASSLRDSWWGSQAALWLTMTAITVVGILWAWQRHQVRLSQPAPAEPPGQPADTSLLPSRGEHLALWVLSLIGLCLFGFCLLKQYPLDSVFWKATLVFWIGIWTGTLYVFGVRWSAARRPVARQPLPGEGVMLWAMVLACLALGMATAPNQASAVAGTVEVGDASSSGRGGHVPKYLGEAWTFVAGERGMIASSPLVAGDRVYVAAVHESAFSPSGTVDCVDRATGKRLWTFDNGGEMKQVFSSPCLANGRLYIGEGFHQDSSCKLFCLEADSGKKVWEFETKSHTESSPCVAGGKVFSGAGDDGVYCLDAATGKEVWHFNSGLHVDASPVVVSNRLYAGSGVGDLHKSTAVFCLDTDTGNEVWRRPTDLPVWGSPAVAGEQVYYGIGNGNFLESEAKPAGALLCVNATTGQPVWRHDVKDGVLGRPAVDAHCVYFGSRDGHCYCVGRHDGSRIWTRAVESPVVTSLALAHCSCCNNTAGVYVLASGGRVWCLDATTGEPFYSLDLSPPSRLLSSPSVVVSRSSDGERRRLYFGAGLRGAATLVCLEDQVQGP